MVRELARSRRTGQEYIPVYAQARHEKLKLDQQVPIWQRQKVQAVGTPVTPHEKEVKKTGHREAYVFFQIETLIFKHSRKLYFQIYVLYSAFMGVYK